MFEYTLNNYFQFGYERPFFEGSDDLWRDQPYGLRRSEHDQWWVRYDSIPARLMGSWRMENARTAELISDQAIKHDLVPLLMFSGGIDSEVMMRAFLDAGREFSVMIIAFEGFLNIHDIAFAVAFCQSRKIDYRLIKVNLESFWLEPHETEGITGLDYMAQHAHTFSPQLCTSLYAGLSEAEPEFLPVFGGGEPHLVYHLGHWCLSEKERIAAFYRAAISMDRPAIPAFFQYNRENAISFMVSPAVTRLYEREGGIDSTAIKYLIYRDSYPDLLTRPKFTGFENVQDLDYTCRTRLKQTYGAYDDRIHTRVADFLEISG